MHPRKTGWNSEKQLTYCPTLLSRSAIHVLGVSGGQWMKACSHHHCEPPSCWWGVAQTTWYWSWFSELRHLLCCHIFNNRHLLFFLSLIASDLLRTLHSVLPLTSMQANRLPPGNCFIDVKRHFSQREAALMVHSAVVPRWAAAPKVSAAESSACSFREMQ